MSRAIELKAKVIQWHALQESAHGRQQANRYAAELFVLTGEVYSFGRFVKVQ